MRKSKADTKARGLPEEGIAMLSRIYVRKKVREYDRRMEELFADCEMRSVTSFDGTRIAYRTVGEGLPLVEAPACSPPTCSSATLRTTSSRGTGSCSGTTAATRRAMSPMTSQSINLPNCAKDLAAVLDDAGIDKAVHVGFSMGVMTILEFYRQYPERVLGLVPIDGPYSEGFGFVSESQRVQSAITRSLRFLSGNTWLVEWFRPMLILPINLPIAKKVELNPTMDSSEEMTLYFGYAAKMDWHAGFQALAAMGEYDATGILDDVDVPTLLICGSKRHLDAQAHSRRDAPPDERLGVHDHSGREPRHAGGDPEMINFRIDLWLRTYFNELVEENAPPAARTVRRKPAAGSSRKKK